MQIGQWPVQKCKGERRRQGRLRITEYGGRRVASNRAKVQIGRRPVQKWKGGGDYRVQSTDSKGIS